MLKHMLTGRNTCTDVSLQRWIHQPPAGSSSLNPAKPYSIKVRPVVAALGAYERTGHQCSMEGIGKLGLLWGVLYGLSNRALRSLVPVVESSQSNTAMTRG